MDEKRDCPRSGIKRHVRAWKETCCLLTISISNLEWSERRAKIVDINATGLGIESDAPLDTSVIWLKESVWGNKCGVVVWCKQYESIYRAGIQFIPLSREDEDYLRQQIEHLEIHKSFPDPKNIIPTLAASV